MTETTVQKRNDEISLFTLATVLLRNRWRIARWMFIGVVLATVSVLIKPRVYLGSTSFIPQQDDSRSGLASIAGQFGLALPGAGQSRAPDFYSHLLTSRIVLLPIVRDTFTVAEMGGKRVPFLTLFKIEGVSPARREELGSKLLKRLVTVEIDKLTGIVNVSVKTEWRSVSLSLTTALLNGVNDYNQHQSRGQATAERQFIEGRLTLAGDDLRVAEDRSRHFLEVNRNLGNSPELMLDRDRLERTLSLRQQTFLTLSQSYEDARAREVRDMPVISMIEPPWVPTVPESRGLLKGIVLGFLLGGFVGMVLAFASSMMAQYQNDENSEAGEFVRTLSDVKREFSNSVRVLTLRKGS